MVFRKDCRKCVHSFIDIYDIGGEYDIAYCYCCGKKRDQFLGMDNGKPLIRKCKSYQLMKLPRHGVNKKWYKNLSDDLPF